MGGVCHVGSKSFYENVLRVSQMGLFSNPSVSGENVRMVSMLENPVALRTSENCSSYLLEDQGRMSHVRFGSSCNRISLIHECFSYEANSCGSISKIPPSLAFLDLGFFNSL